ncbi:MAG: GxxExxY protein [Bacteroidetes bacterium]|nr:GxxExxY protein [Bacteroidota bacterium]
MAEILYKDESYLIQGAIFEVYREMGYGFLEGVYQECLEKEFSYRNIPFYSQQTLTLYYKESPLNQIYKPDFVCFDKIIIELKSVSKLNPEHRAQVINYLKATKIRLGILVNFGHHPKVEIERILL